MPCTGSQAIIVSSNAGAASVQPLRLSWRTLNGDKQIRYRSDPEASMKQRMEVLFLRMLPVESLL